MVKKLLVLLAMVLAVIACSVAPAFADDDDDDDGGGGGGPPTLVEFTAGEGTAYYGVGVPATFNFDVQRGPTGPPIGGGTFTSAFEVAFAGPATCLEVEGNLAVFEIDDNAGRDIRVEVADFGTPGETLTGEGDEINFFFIDTADAECPAPTRTTDPLIVGDIMVGERTLGGGDGDDEDEDDDDEDDDDDGRGGLGGGVGDDDDD